MEYSKCNCKAITIYFENGESVSFKNRSALKVDLRKMKRLKTTYCCDHCVNHYGLDLCACGSGEPFEKCKEGFPECGQPHQKLEPIKFNHYAGKISIPVGRIASAW